MHPLAKQHKDRQCWKCPVLCTPRCTCVSDMRECVCMFKWGGAPCVHIHLEARNQWWVSSSIHLSNWDKVSYWSWSSLVLPLYPKILCPAFWALGLLASCHAGQPRFQVGSEDPTLALRLYPLSHLSSLRCSITQVTHASSWEGWGGGGEQNLLYENRNV